MRKNILDHIQHFLLKTNNKTQLAISHGYMQFNGNLVYICKFTIYAKKVDSRVLEIEIKLSHGQK